MLNLIVAIDKSNGISKNNQIPWFFKKDLQFFKNLTNNSVVIMGRNTWETIPDEHRPLKNRINIIVSTTMHEDEIKDYENTYLARSFEESVLKYPNKKQWVIGGRQLYLNAILSKLVDEVYITKINNDYECDNIFPLTQLLNFYNYDQIRIKTEYEDNTKLDFIKYKTHNFIIEHHQPTTKDENNYLNLLRKILLEDSIGRETRNARTFSIFGTHLEFNLKDQLPLLTTKRVYWRGIVEELLFFIRGDTNSNHLVDKKVKIWEPNTTREFLDSRNLDYEQGDLGPMYGWNWRFFGADYKGMNSDYKNKGFDQLKNVIDQLQNDQTSRRIMITAFDPSKVKESVLAPCHSIIVQFYVRNGHLESHMYQRSVDSFLGLPFNISSHSLLVYLLCEITGLKPGRLIMSFGDTHIYEAHREQVLKQIMRTPKEFPKLEILKKYNHSNNKLNDKLEYLENLTYDDFKLIDYNHHGTIKAKMIA